MDEVKGIDAYTSKQHQLDKLECKIKELTEAVDGSLQELESFSLGVKQEFFWFEKQMVSL